MKNKKTVVQMILSGLVILEVTAGAVLSHGGQVMAIEVPPLQESAAESKDVLQEMPQVDASVLEKFLEFQFQMEPATKRGQIAPILEWDTAKLLPGYWCAADLGKKPVVKSQGHYGTCWAITATSALESTLLPEEHLVFSADHMVRNNAFTVDIDDGGDYLMTMAYLSGWQGPVLDAEDPYGDGFSPADLKPIVHVQEMQILNDASVSEIKKAVYQYGAMQTSLYMSHSTTKAGKGYYLEDTCGYYYPEKRTQNHDILILGWDDNFSRFKFVQTPKTDGAFICQNTWGDDFGENGIFYVSYEDANIGVTGIVFDRIEHKDNYDRIYQTDDCGWQGRQGYGSDTCWMANAYMARENEVLSAVGFYATGEDTSYEIYLVKGFEGEDSFKEKIYLQSGTLQRAGFYTIDLDQSISLIQGETFAVIIKITTPGSENPVAVEYQADEYTQNVTLEGKNGFLSQTGEKWEHTEKKFGTNVCLKVYTRNWTP